MAHFWLGTSGVAYLRPSDAWITEGGAEMMAFTLLAATDHDHALGELQRTVQDCSASATKPVARAGERHDGRTVYACGATFALAAAGAQRRQGGGDYFDFLLPLLAAHRSDRAIGHADWLAHFAATTGGGETAATTRAMLDTGVADPVATLATLFRQTGVPCSRNGDTLTLAATAISCRRARRRWRCGSS